jgi:hypothetical protein
MQQPKTLLEEIREIQEGYTRVYAAARAEFLAKLSERTDARTIAVAQGQSLVGCQYCVKMFADEGVEAVTCRGDNPPFVRVTVPPK